MGLFSRLFAPPAPTGTAPRMPLKRFTHPWVELPPIDYTVIDLETTGLDACTCEILEIGAIQYRENKEVRRYHTLIRPEGAIPREASRINHITWKQVHSAPRLAEIEADFFNFIGNDTIIGYNIGFDIKFVQTRTGIDVKNQVFDVLNFVRKAYPSLDSYKLDSLRGRFGLLGIGHTALGDCEATAQILQKCMESAEGKNICIAIQQYNERKIAQEQQLREHLEKRYNQLMEKKAASRQNALPQKELARISMQMTGTPEEYISRVFQILSKHDIPTQDITAHGNFLRINWIDFWGVKLTGKLKYIVLNLSPENIHCDFACTPTTMAEGEDSTRVYISTPDDLNELENQVIASFNRAVELKSHPLYPVDI